jgi:hypothetical protein
MNEIKTYLAVEYDQLILQEKYIIDCLDSDILLQTVLDQLEFFKNQ